MKITEVSYLFAYISFGFLYLVDPILKQGKLIDIFFNSYKVKEVHDKEKRQN